MVSKVLPTGFSDSGCNADTIKKLHKLGKIGS